MIKYIAVAAISLFSFSAIADDLSPEQLAAKVGVDIANQVNSPEHRDDVEQKGSGFLMNAMCNATFQKRADLRPICLKAAQNRDMDISQGISEDTAQPAVSTAPEKPKIPVLGIADIVAYGSAIEGKTVMVKGYAICFPSKGVCGVISESGDENEGAVYFPISADTVSFELRKRLIYCTENAYQEDRLNSKCEIGVQGEIHHSAHDDDASHFVIASPDGLAFLDSLN